MVYNYKYKDIKRKFIGIFLKRGRICFAEYLWDTLCVIFKHNGCCEIYNLMVGAVLVARPFIYFRFIMRGGIFKAVPMPMMPYKQLFYSVWSLFRVARVWYGARYMQGLAQEMLGLFYNNNGLMMGFKGVQKRRMKLSRGNMRLILKYRRNRWKKRFKIPNTRNLYYKGKPKRYKRFQWHTLKFLTDEQRGWSKEQWRQNKEKKKLFDKKYGPHFKNVGWGKKKKKKEKKENKL